MKLHTITFASGAVLFCIILIGVSCQKGDNAGNEMPDQEVGTVTETNDRLQYPWEGRFSGNRRIITETGGTMANLASREVVSVNPLKGNGLRVFLSGNRMRAILPVNNGMYLITTNTFPQVGEAATATDKLLWVPNN